MRNKNKGTKGYKYWRKRQISILPGSILLFIATFFLVVIKCYFHNSFEEPFIDWLSFVIGLIPILIYIGLIIPLFVSFDFKNRTKHGAIKSILGVIPSILMCVLPFVYDATSVALLGFSVIGWGFIIVMFVMFCLIGFVK